LTQQTSAQHLYSSFSSVSKVQKHGFNTIGSSHQASVIIPGADLQCFYCHNRCVSCSNGLVRIWKKNWVTPGSHTIEKKY